MARLSRTVIPEIPHHVTQRGNRRQQTFFRSADYEMYKRCMQQACEAYGVEIWAYCLMPNHIHLIAVPSSRDSLAAAIGRGHEAYTRYLNFLKGWKGYLWQGRFRSFPMDERYLLVAARYIELNPVRAHLAESAEEYPWSSARAHLLSVHDPLVKTEPILERVPSWREFLGRMDDPAEIKTLQKHQQTNWPLGSTEFLERLEVQVGGPVVPRKPGPKPSNHRT